MQRNRGTSQANQAVSSLTPYQRVLRERFESLPPMLRRFLGQAGGGSAFGRLRVACSRDRLRNFLATVLGIPPAGEYDMLLEVSPCGETQRWVRRFGEQVLETYQSEYQGLLVETSGPASIGFELVLQEGTLRFQPRRAWVFGIRLPLWLAPCIIAENSPSESGGWHVRVRFGVPLLGKVAEYEGVVMANTDAKITSRIASQTSEGVA